MNIKTEVPNIFGTSYWFHGRQFFHGLSWGRWFGDNSSALHLLCTLCQLSSVQWLSRVRLFATPWIAACQVSLSITNSWSLLRLMSIELVMPPSHLILCHPLLLLLPIPPSIRVFSSESTLCMRWPKIIKSAPPAIRSQKLGIPALMADVKKFWNKLCVLITLVL